MSAVSEKIVPLNASSKSILAEYRLHPERMELARTMERWLALSEGDFHQEVFAEPRPVHQILTRLRAFPKLEAASREMEKAGPAARQALYVSVDWIRFRLDGRQLLQTTDEADLLLRHSELDAGVPVWALHVGNATRYVAFGESWASRPWISGLGPHDVKVEGAYVTGRQTRPGQRELDITVIGRRKVGRAGHEDFAELRTITIDDDRAPLATVLARQLARRPTSGPATLDPGAIQSVCVHLVKTILLDAVLTDDEATGSGRSERRVAATHPLPARLTDDLKPVAAVFPKLIVGPMSLDGFLPSNIHFAPEDTVWSWTPGLMTAREEQGRMFVHWDAPSLRPTKPIAPLQTA